jgi:hypothetical protein
VLLSWPFGLAFAFGSAVATSIGFLMRYRGAVAAPDVEIRRPVWTVVELFKQKWWAIGFGVAIIAWLLHVAALKLAPLSLVQAAIASSFVGLGVAADRFAMSVTKRQWTGIALVTLGLALLGGMAPEAKPDGAQSEYDVVAGIAFVTTLAGVAGALILGLTPAGRIREHRALCLGAAAGLFFTVSHVAIKAITGGGSFPHSLLTGWSLVAVAAFVIAFFSSARSLQIGEAVPVIAITGAASNVTAIASGIVVFGDPIGETPAVIAARVIGFLLVAFSTFLMPAPLGAAEELAERERQQIQEAEAEPRERRFARSDAAVAAR